jgi:hypothetical protein
MPQWIKCTENKSGETIYVNIARAMSLTPGRKGGTIIAFPGDKKDYVAVSERPEDLIEIEADHDPNHEYGAGKSCPCNSRAMADHASS